MALRVDPVTGIRADNDENGIYEYFYHENPPPEIEEQLPSLFDGLENSEDTSLNQAQKLLQPEIVLPAKPAAAKPAENTPRATENAAKNPLNAH
jgi:penicillin-binding protein 1A